MTHPLAALIAGVQRRSFLFNEDDQQYYMAAEPNGDYVLYADILAALDVLSMTEAATLPDLVEAGKVLENAGRLLPFIPKGLEPLLDNIIALATAQAAQIAGLKANVSYWTGEIDTVLAGRADEHDRAEAAEAKAEAEAATLRAEVERLRGALQAFKDFDDLPTMEKRPDVFELRVRQPILRALEEEGRDG